MEYNLNEHRTIKLNNKKKGTSFFFVFLDYSCPRWSWPCEQKEMSVNNIYNKIVIIYTISPLW
jgi:hypothetical protein